MNTRNVSVSRVLVLGAMAFGLWACPIVPPADTTLLGDGWGGDTSSGDNDNDTVNVVSVELTPSSATLKTGDTLQLTAVARDSGGQVVNVSGFDWWSSNAGIASVNAAGVVTAGGTEGTAYIYASVNGVQGSASIYVDVPQVRSITIAGAGGTLLFGATQQLSVTVSFEDDTSSTNPAVVTWQSSNPYSVAVSSDGLAQAIGLGTASVTASLNGVTSNAITFTAEPAGIVLNCGSVGVVSAGSAFSCSVAGTDGSGNVVQALSSESVSFGSPQLGGIIASISAAGYVTTSSTGDGQATITANYSPSGEGAPLSDEAVIDVVRISNVTISGSSADLVSGNSRDITATLTRYSGGQVPAEIVPYWTTDEGSSVLLKSSEVGMSVTVTGNDIGTTGIRAGVGNVYSAPIEIRVVPQSVAVSPAGPVQLEEGQTQQFIAYPKNVSGGTVSLDYHGTATVTWSSDDDGVVMVTDGGYATAETAGSTTVRVTVNGVEGSAGVTVIALPENPAFEGLSSASRLDVDSVSLSWPAATDAQTPASLVYDIYWDTDGSLTFSAGEKQVTGVTATSYQADGLTAGLTYVFGVRARDPQGNTDSNTITRTVYMPAPNPAAADTILFLDNGTARYVQLTAQPPTPAIGASVSLGLVSPSMTGGGSKITGPRFLEDGKIVGIAYSGGPLTRQVYVRDDNGTYTYIASATDSTSMGGVSSPGQAVAFGLTGSSSDKIAFTVSGSTTGLVNLVLYDRDDGSQRTMVYDIKRAAPMPGGKIVYVFYDNLYLLTPPATLSGGTATIKPLSLGGGYDDVLVFGRKNGANDEVVVIDPATSEVTLIDPTDGSVISSGVFITPALADVASGYVLSTGTGSLTGDIVVQQFVGTGNHHVLLIDVDAGAAYDLTPGGALGAPTLDTAN